MTNIQIKCRVLDHFWEQVPTPSEKGISLHLITKMGNLSQLMLRLTHNIFISNLHRHRPLRVHIHTLVEWSLGDSF